MEYTVIRSARRSLAIQIKRDGKVIVRANYKTSLKSIEKFLSAKSAWIKKHLSEIEKREVLPKFTDKEINDFIQAAKRIIPEKSARFAAALGVSYGRITIRREKTVWGSCTARGNLNFNCLLAAVPPEILDYVVIHELCHRKEMNHSKKFWAIVASVCPEYKERRRWLKTEGEKYLIRL